MTHEELEEAVPLYAIGAMDRQDRQPLEAHLLTGCPSCHAALREYRAVAGLLPYGLPPAAAPAGLKTNILAALAHDAARPERPRPSEKASLEPGGWMNHVIPPEPRLRIWGLHPVLALGLVAALGGTAIYALTIRSQALTEAEQRQRVETALQEEAVRIAALQQQVAEQERLLAGLKDEFGSQLGDLSELRETLAQRESELNQMRPQLARQEKELASLRKALAQRDELLTFLRSPKVKVVSLAGLERAKSAGALLLFDPETNKAFFFAFNMPPPPVGKTYQLWAIVDKPVSAGTFATDAGRKGRLVIHSIPDFARVTKFAVSLEPEGGRPQPTGDLYLLGQV
jgi:anti-sigma-K factor RskA